MRKHIYSILWTVTVILFYLVGLANSGQSTQVVLKGWTPVLPTHHGKEIGQRTIYFGKTGERSLRIITKKTSENEYAYMVEFFGKNRQVFEVCRKDVSPNNREYTQDVYIYELSNTSLVKVELGAHDDDGYGCQCMFVFQDGIWKRIFLPSGFVGYVYGSQNNSYLYYAQYMTFGDLNLEERYFGLAMKESGYGLELQSLEIPLFSELEKRVVLPSEYTWRYEKGLRIDKGDKKSYCVLFGKRQLEYFKDALNIERNRRIAAQYKESIPYIKVEAKKNIDLIERACGWK
jgi:hypothetical protein